MATDTKSMELLIRMVPLMRREFARSIDASSFFTDSQYARAVIEEALRAKEPRLVAYARELRFRLEELAKGPVSGVRSSSGPRTEGPLSRSAGPSTLPAATDSGLEPPAGPDDPPLGGKYLKSLR